MPRIVNEKLIAHIKTLGCIICGVTPNDAHHVKTKSSNGDDLPQNLCPLCRSCHQEWHRTGTTTMANRHQEVKSWLETNGWYLCPILISYRHAPYRSYDTDQASSLPIN